jgi:predicted CXXCH cytochrome family protein
MNRRDLFLYLLVCTVCIVPRTGAAAKTGIIGTKHDLSAKTGPGPYKALTEDRICVFCHTPHNAFPQTPLWNKKMEGINYDQYPPYSSSTRLSPATGPTGASRLCLSCHDGTLALGEVRLPSKKIDMTVPGGIPFSRPSNFGVSLASHHPISFEYSKALPNPELYSPGLPPGLLFYGYDIIECTTCHDPHDNTNKKFLAKSNEGSGLCVTCHNNKDGWTMTSHRTSLSEWSGGDPNSNPWPRTGAGTDFGWITVQQNGCENCHAPHSAGGAQRLLNFDLEEQNCYPCHNGRVASKNIQAQFSKQSRHHVELYNGIHDPKTEKQSPEVFTAHVECVDCHNPHASNGRTAFTTEVSGKLEKVTGVDRYNNPKIAPVFARYEYEVCFKCHADSSPLAPYIERIINTTNTRFEFNPVNPSYHPVVAVGKHQASPGDVPSLPSADLEAPLNLSTASSIYCTDCHSDEVVVGNVLMSRGPHGSPYPPILRRRYETTVGTPENLQNYGLCYRCHNRDSILDDTKSFRWDLASHPGATTTGGHRGHLQSPATHEAIPCSVCHDPHGVQDVGGSGSHTYLVNFDKMIVKPLGANVYPVYTDNLNHSGSCTLECHFPDATVKQHNNATYP